MRGLKLIVLQTLLLGVLLLSPLLLRGQPSYGLVVSREGEIIFSDVFHKDGTLWKVSTNGNLTALATKQKCYYLCKDKQGIIWGGNFEFNLSSRERFSSLWKMEVLGRIKEVIPYTNNPHEFKAQNFVVDSQGWVFFESDGVLYKRNPSIAPVKIADLGHAGVSSLYLDDQDRLYAAVNDFESGAILEVKENEPSQVIASHLFDRAPDLEFSGNKCHRLFAIYKDGEGSFFVANGLNRCINRITRNNEKEVYYRSSSPWFPVSMVKKGRRAYILEIGYEPERGFLGPRIIQKKGINEFVLANAEEWEKKPLSSSFVFMGNRNIERWFVGLLLSLSVVFLFISARKN